MKCFSSRALCKQVCFNDRKDDEHDLLAVCSQSHPLFDSAVLPGEATESHTLKAIYSSVCVKTLRSVLHYECLLEYSAHVNY